jgi:hypothetical protein
MKLPPVQLSPFSSYFIPLRSKHSPQHPVLKHPQSMLFPQCERPSFTPILNKWQNYSCVYFNHFILQSDITDFCKYRGISLLLTSYKILSSILLSRLTTYADEIIGITYVHFDVKNQLKDMIFCMSDTG